MLGREDQPIEIIGVVGNARTDAVVTEAEPEIYFCFWEAFPFTKHMLVRTASDPRSLMRAVQNELHLLEPTVSVANIKTLSQIREESVAVQTFARRLLVGFSIVALILTSVGIYGVLSLSVASRQREMAIRMAVGATDRNILRLILVEGFRSVASGLILGGVLSVAMADALKSLLYGIPAIDPTTYAGVVSLFCAVALIACWLPARRATRIYPVQVLRSE